MFNSTTIMNMSNVSNATYHTVEVPVNTHRVLLTIISIVFTALGTLAIFARLWRRTFITRLNGLDDYAIYGAWVASVGFTTCCSVELVYGIGKFSMERLSEQVTNIIIVEFFLELFYYITMYLIKMSILLIYIRLSADVRRVIFYMSIFVMVALTAQFIPTIILSFFQCRPPFFFWRTSIIGNCISQKPYYYEYGIFGIVADIAILVLPIALLLKSNTNMRTKLGLMGPFFTGIVSTICSCTRLYSISTYLESTEALYDAATVISWSLVEMNLGILCASGPSLTENVKLNIGSRQSSVASLSLGLISRSVGRREGFVNWLEKSTMATTKDVEPGLMLDPRESRVETVCFRGSTITIPDIEESNSGTVRIAVRTNTVQVRSFKNGGEKLES